MDNLNEQIEELFKTLNESREEEKQFSDYRLNELARDICDLISIKNRRIG